MPAPTIHKTTTFEDYPKVLMARVVGEDGANVTQGTFTSITAKTFDSADLSTAVIDTTLTIANVIFDTLQTGTPWLDEQTGLAIDSTGYNFKHTAPGAWFPTPDRVVVVEIIGVTAGEDIPIWIGEVSVLPIHGI